MLAPPRCVVLSLEEFRILPHSTITVPTVIQYQANYSGVPLATLLEKINAPLGKEFHHEALTSYLVAPGPTATPLFCLSLKRILSSWWPDIGRGCSRRQTVGTPSLPARCV